MEKFSPKMQGILLHQDNPNLLRVILSLKKEEIQTTQPRKGQLLVKMEAAPCNPSDIAFMRGMYNIKKNLPKVLGFEGAGIVCAVADEENQYLTGKRVACFSQANTHGTWAEYFLCEAKQCLIIRDAMPLEQAACFFVNPFTAYAMFEKAREKGISALIQNAAGGQIGRFISVFAKKAGIALINIVRKSMHVEELKARGEKYVLNMQDEDFEQRLKEYAHDLGAHMAFDAVGGLLGAQIFHALPENSEMMVFGGLSGEKIPGIDVMELIFKKKRISGFDLNQWMAVHSSEEIQKTSDHLQHMIIAGDLQTHIQKKVDADHVVEGLKQYIKNMSAGKILIDFSYA
jgi:NADPH:quinone reductase